MSTHYNLVDSNKRKSAVVIIFFIAFILFLGMTLVYTLDYPLSFMGIMLIFSGVMSFSSYYFSDKIILKLSSARPATREEFFNYFTAAENLSLVAQIPMPKLYVIDDTAMNAFATGRDPDHAVICATTGLLSRLDRTEVEGVVAHEMSHIKNYDIRLMSIVSILVGFVALLADWSLRAGILGGRGKKSSSGKAGGILALVGLVLIILSPIIANLIKLAISRRREFLADATAISFTRQPSGLSNALAKLSQDQEPLEAANKATAHLYITNPLKNRKDAVGWFSGLFNTHPPIQERIDALQKLGTINTNISNT